MFPDLVAPPYSLLALDKAGQLDQELVVAVGLLASVHEMLGANPTVGLLVKSLRAVVAASSSARQLRRQLANLANNNAEAPIEVVESSLRARWSVVFRAVHMLSHSEPGMPATAFKDPFASVKDVVAHLIDRLAEIHDRWSKQRKLHKRFDPVTRRALSYAALDEAEVAFDRLGRDPSLRHFLRVGAKSSSLSSVRTACREIAATLGLRLDGDREVTPGVSAARLPRVLRGDGR